MIEWLGVISFLVCVYGLVVLLLIFWNNEKNNIDN